MVLSMDRWVDKVAIVTGASSGIGADIASTLVKTGLKVVGLARRKERLTELAKNLSDSKGKFYPIQTDLTNEQDILNAFKWIKENLGPVSILINNAGVACPSSVLKDSSQNWRRILDTNVLAVTIATKEAIANMTENKIDGHIVNISSIAGHYVLDIPWVSLYTASKQAIVALTEAIRLELLNENSKIRITNISPGLVATEMPPEDFFKNNRYLKAEDISDGIIYALSTPPHVQIQEIMIRPISEPQEPTTEKEKL